MILEATKACSMCGVEYALSSFPKNRRQCRVCRQAYFQRWRRGFKAREHRERQLRVRRRHASPNLEKPPSIAYAVERYGKSDPSAADVLDAIEPDSSDRRAAGYGPWRRLVDRVVREANGI